MQREPGAGRWGRDLAILCTATALLYGILCWHPLMGSYPRYVLSAREMVESGDWVVPRLCYVPYFEKPILIYWISAACQLLFGTSSFAIHLPSGIAALISVVSTYALGRKFRSPDFGLAAALMLLASAQFLVMTTMLTCDPLFASWLTLAWLAFWLHDREPQRRWIWLFWVALALAWLTKGPLALVLVGLSLAGFFLLSGGWRALWSEAWKLRPFAGLGVIALINLPWHALVWQRDPRFLEMFYLRINVRGLYDEKINHPGPFWYYVGVTAGSLLPWAFLGTAAMCVGAWQSIARAVRDRCRDFSAATSSEPRAASTFTNDPERGRLYLACMVVFPLLFLSASASKLATYLLPLLPGIVLLAADVIVSRAPRPPAWLRWSAAVQAALFVLAIGGALALFRERIPWDKLQPAGRPLFYSAVALFLGGMVWGAVLLVRRRVLAGMWISGAGMVLGLCVLLPRIDRAVRTIYAEELAHQALMLATPDDRIVVSEHCVQDYTITWALKRRAGVLGKPRELSMGHFTEVTPTSTPLPEDLTTVRLETLAQNPWLYDLPKLEREWREPRRMWFFANCYSEQDPRDEVEHLRAAGLSIFEIGRVENVALLTNQPLPAAR